jgi:hypothetical protein
VGHTSEHTRLGYRGAAFDPANAADGDMFLAKAMQEKPARFVIANHSYRQHCYAQVSEIVDGVASASRDDGALAVPQDQHWRFA